MIIQPTVFVMINLHESVKKYKKTGGVCLSDVFISKFVQN